MENSRNTSKIAFVTTMAGVPWGGSEELWGQTAMRLLEEGHDVAASVFQWPTRPAPLERISSAGGRLAFRPHEQAFPQRVAEKFRQRLSPSPLPTADMNWLRAERPDLVVISQGGPWDGVLWMTACRELGIPYCPIVHAHSEIWWPMDEDLAAGRQALSGARKVFFVSKANLNQMEMQAGMRLDHAEVVVNPWKVDASHPVAWPEETSVIEIACVGRIDPRAKGQDVLLKVLALPKWRERPIRLNLYGDGPCEESLKAMASLLDLKNVVFQGQVSDVKSIWAKNHALVLPSRYEGLPLVIVEAMFCGRPVITTDVAGNAEYLRDNVTGFIAEAPTVSLLDGAMERAWARRSEWRDIGLQARHDAVEAIPSDPIAEFTRNLLTLVNNDRRAVAGK
ncbi:MAG: glycosyltransferase family 4 protein [Luteolibacter sp.]|uniref:glycosyltransferase family 4 protein n=1 Tax=Luteolibacter sp. TaxID=1962973 RepID=UPI0032651B1D